MAADMLAAVTRAKVQTDPKHGLAILQALQAGLAALAAWMQDLLRPLLQDQDALAGGRDFTTFLTASHEDRRGAFLATAARRDPGEVNVEMDFWVCWTLDARLNRLTGDRPA